MAVRERIDRFPNHYVLRDEETGRFIGTERIADAQRQDVRQSAETTVPAGHGGRGDQRANPRSSWTVEQVAGVAAGLGLLAIPAYKYIKRSTT